MTYKLELIDVSKSFGSKVVLSGVNLQIQSGESWVILGGSGSGKSVLLKCILGLISPDSGKILFEGKDVTSLSGREREDFLFHFGMLFQGGALFDSLKVWENVSFRPLQEGKMSITQAHDLALQTLARVGLGKEVASLYPAELSGGMQKRVSLARAISGGASVLFFDEPTTGLDPIMADVINRLIVRTVKDMGATGLTITHDMHSMRTIADKVAMLYGGKMIWKGSVSEVDTCGNPYVHQFIHGQAEGPIPVTA